MQDIKQFYSSVVYSSIQAGRTNLGWAHDSPKKEPTGGRKTVELMWNVATDAVFILSRCRMWGEKIMTFPLPIDTRCIIM